ncbi:hypothetical protein O9G_006404, partial [Rozella allomycis CSF55]
MDCEEFKRTALIILSVLIERMGSDMLPFEYVFIQQLPLLWNSCEQDNLFKSSIIMFVKTFKSDSTVIYDFATNLILFSTDIHNDSSLFLMEDGLLLWISLISNSNQLNSHLLSLFDRLFSLLDIGSENLRLV